MLAVTFSYQLFEYRKYLGLKAPNPTPVPYVGPISAAAALSINGPDWLQNRR